MKKHNFNQAMDIFKQMFDGWVLVLYDGKKYPVTSVNPANGLVFNHTTPLGLCDISHLEQTKPMSGDEVWAWDGHGHGQDKEKRFYIGKTKGDFYACENSAGAIAFWENVELIAPKRKLTIEEATELLRKGERVDGEFEIIKD